MKSNPVNLCPCEVISFKVSHFDALNLELTLLFKFNKSMPLSL